MILNEKEKNQLIELLKKQYNTSKEMLDNNEYDWIKDDKTHEAYINYINDLKTKYEELESKEVVEIETNLNFTGKDGWYNIVGLIVLLALFGDGICCGDNIYTNPDNNKNLN